MTDKQTLLGEIENRYWGNLCAAFDCNDGHEAIMTFLKAIQFAYAKGREGKTG